MLDFSTVIVECWDNSATLVGATLLTGASGTTIPGINFVVGGPSPVRNLKGAPSTGRVVLTWDAPAYSGWQADHRLHRRSTPPPTGAWTTFPDGVSPATRSATITGLTANVEYRFRVTARNANGLGPATTVLAPTVPTAPRSLTARLRRRGRRFRPGAAVVAGAAVQRRSRGDRLHHPAVAERHVGLGDDQRRCAHDDVVHGDRAGQRDEVLLPGVGQERSSVRGCQQRGQPDPTTGVPTAPRTLSATPGSGQVRLSWCCRRRMAASA